MGQIDTSSHLLFDSMDEFDPAAVAESDVDFVGEQAPEAGSESAAVECDEVKMFVSLTCTCGTVIIIL